MKKIIILAFTIALLNPFFVYAQDKTSTEKTTTDTSTNPATGFPAYNSGVDNSIKDYLCTPSEPADGLDLQRCVGRLQRFSITVGALVLIFFLVISGYTYMTGGENGKKSAKTMLQNSFVGMAILLGSYLLLAFINPNLVTYKAIQPPIFETGGLASCEDIGFGSKCGGSSGNSTTGNSSTSGGGSPISSGDLANKKVFMFGDSLTKGFAEQLKKQVSMSQFEVHGEGGSTIEDWLNGGSASEGVVPKISDRLKQLSTKPDVVIVMLGTNNARGGVKSDSVKSMKDKLQGYSAIWIAPPKFTQPSCYKITHENSASADNSIASNFTGSGYSVFKSADKNIDLKLSELSNCKPASGQAGSGFEIHPGATGHSNWVKAFLSK